MKSEVFTKADGKELKREMATELKGYATKADGEKLKKEIISEMKRQTKEMKYHFDAAVETIEEDLKGANTDEISSMKDADNKLHERIVPFEEQIGIKSPAKPHPIAQA